MNNKNEIKLINACIRKNKEIKKLKNEIVDLIEIFQILQKTLDFEFAFDLRENWYLLTNRFEKLDIVDYEKLKNAIERYGIK